MTDDRPTPPEIPAPTPLDVRCAESAREIVATVRGAHPDLRAMSLASYQMTQSYADTVRYVEAVLFAFAMKGA